MTEHTINLETIDAGERIDVPVEFDELLGREELKELKQDLARIAKVRRSVAVEAAALRLG